MKTHQHTPGPWNAKTNLSGSLDFFGNGGEKVIACEVRLVNQEANARLIAAAPDLLEALEKICAGNNMAGRENWSTHDVIQEHYKIAHSAIAKATGKEAA